MSVVLEKLSPCVGPDPFCSDFLFFTGSAVTIFYLQVLRFTPGLVARLDGLKVAAKSWLEDLDAADCDVGQELLDQYQLLEELHTLWALADERETQMDATRTARYCSLTLVIALAAVLLWQLYPG